MIKQVPMASKLFSTLTIRGTTFSNRLWVSPMCQYSAVEGVPQDWHFVHLGSLAVGGPGLVMAEATAVAPEGRITPVCTGIWNDEQAQQWKRIVRFITSQGVPAGIQLAHAGRKASTDSIARGSGPVDPEEGGWPTIAPSPRPYGRYAPPQELDEEGIARVVVDFASAARRSVQAGFSVIEIHAAHGYLIHEFLSPLSNFRTDRYGGSPRNRARILFEIVDAVRGAIPESTPLFIRFSATDWVDGGWDVTDLAELVGPLEERGVDLFDISSAGLDPRQQIPIHPGYQVHLSRAIKQVARVPVGAVGLMTTPREFEDTLQAEDADVIFAGREFLRDRMLVRRAAVEFQSKMEWPEQYLMAKFPGAIP
jgi:2,4-dienoyl-CoA reductase-like NADH-dependent reductase (Old Yellow Enzyme family)